MCLFARGKNCKYMLSLSLLPWRGLDAASMTRTKRNSQRACLTKAASDGNDDYALTFSTLQDDPSSLEQSLIRHRLRSIQNLCDSEKMSIKNQ